MNSMSYYGQAESWQPGLKSQRLSTLIKSDSEIVSADHRHFSFDSGPYFT